MKKTVAFIPLRKGSKGIPFKNHRNLHGKPLFFWAMEAAINSSAIDQVVISTNCDQVLSYKEKLTSNKLIFFRRTEAFAADESSTESAMYEYFEREKCQRIVLIQATSPMLKSKHLNEALQNYDSKGYDSMLSSVEFNRFLWESRGDSMAALNYQPQQRPRRQNFSGYQVENGAFYISDYNRFMKEKCRLHGRVGTYTMPKESLIEIDDEDDWRWVEVLMSREGKGL